MERKISCLVSFIVSAHESSEGRGGGGEVGGAGQAEAGGEGREVSTGHAAVKGCGSRDCSPAHHAHHPPKHAAYCIMASPSSGVQPHTVH